MKKLFILASFAVLTYSCSKKATPVASVEKKTETNMAVTAPVMDKGAQIADGEKLYTARCGKCHELHKPDEFTVAEWPGILRSMAPKAKLNQSMKDMVMAYVTANAKK
jgi:cytochrome c5